MIRGFLAGALWGIVIGAVVLAMTSQLADWRNLSPAITERDAETEVVAEAQPVKVDRAPAVAVPTERAPRTGGEAPRVAAGAAGEMASPSLDTAPPTPPVAGAPVGAMPDRLAGAEAPVVPAPVDGPAFAPPKLAAASAPEADTPPEPGETAPAPASRAPDALAELDDVAMPDAPETRPDAPVLATQDPETAPVVASLDAPRTASERAAPEAAPAPPEPPAPVTAAGTEPKSAAEPDAVAGAEPPKATEETVAPVAQAGAVPVAPPVVDPAPKAALAAPEPAPAVESSQVAETGGEGGRSALQPQIIRIAEGEQVGLPGRRVTGLPRVGAGTETDTEAQAEDPTAAVGENADEGTNELSALDRNRQPFEAPEGAGLIAVVLVLEDGAPVDLSPLGGGELPVTIAVPAGLPDAAGLARTYRAEGHEIVLVPDLPEGAGARDVEVALPVALDAVPGAVAVMDPGAGGFQDDRGATASVVASLAGTGHGLLTWNKGFNSAQRLAGQEGVPAALVFRPLEAGDPDAVVRALEQAALRARQEGGAVMAGPADAGVIAGIAAWAAGTRREDTALAPLSALLLGG